MGDKEWFVYSVSEFGNNKHHDVEYTSGRVFALFIISPITTKGSALHAASGFMKLVTSVMVKGCVWLAFQKMQSGIQLIGWIAVHDQAHSAAVPLCIASLLV